MRYLGLILAAAAWLVRSMLIATHDAAVSRGAAKLVPVRPLDEIEILTVVIGFAIGYLVPSWYREAPAERRGETTVTSEAGVTIARP